MPFIGRDWRSPGEAWVKTESLGWQRMKIIESQLRLTCPQSTHPACSWPPRNQFGQHMANNCNKALSKQQDSPPTSCLSGSLDSDRSSGSSSCASSSSGSPTGSPEKSARGVSEKQTGGKKCVGLNLHREHHNHQAKQQPLQQQQQSQQHHLHPITISSPYGSYSALSSCCAHHYHAKRTGDDAAQMSRSLSREALNATPSPSPPPPTTTTTTIQNPTSHLMCNESKLRHNKSLPEFNASFNHRHTTQAQDGDARQTTSASEPLDGLTFKLDETISTTPLILENGIELQDNCNASSSCNKNKQSDTKPPATTTTTSASAHSANATGNNNSHERCTLNYCHCCCCLHDVGLSKQLASQQLLNNDMIGSENEAPYCRISVRTREVAMHNTISEAFYRLDFYNAIHDIRRFNYICKLLHLLITQNLTSLSGCATRVLFTMLEQVAWEVASNKRNIHVIRNLLDELRQTIEKYYCWGRPIGSTSLWQHHFETIERISQIVDEIELAPPEEDSYKMTFDKLPVEMIREILLRLNDYRDLVSSAQASSVMRKMVDGQSIWHKLCRYHFSDQQMRLAFEGTNLRLLVRRTNANLGSLRGIKYARTTSADGKHSYRNPVAHKQVVAAAASSSTSTTTKSNSSERIIKTVNKFHHHHQNDSNDNNADETITKKRSTNDQRASGQVVESVQSKPSSSLASQTISTTGAQAANERPAYEIDWERVFHQLRKRFGLKEEYADCLLLCRHCRCLFWKSFGHPCIRSDQPHSTSTTSKVVKGVESTGEGVILNAACNEHRMQLNDAAAAAASRPSVASLSRNFDRRATARGGATSSNSLNDENLLPLNQRQQQPLASQQQQQQQPGFAQRHPLSNLSAQLRERHNASARHHDQLDANRNAQLQNGPLTTNGQRRKELVPKHVTVTPQAFLKFFSL